MKKGICARHYNNLSPDTFFGAGFEEISAVFPNCAGASEICADSESFEEALALAIAQGIPTLVVPSSTPLAVFLKNFKKIKNSDIKIAFENDFGYGVSSGSLAKSIDKINERFGEKKFFACLNTGHSVLSGEEAEDAVKALGERLISVHANDNHRTGDYHLIAFRGRRGVHWKETMQALSEINYQGTLFMDSSIGPENRFPSVLDKCLKMTLTVCEHLIKLCEVGK